MNEPRICKWKVIRAGFFFLILAGFLSAFNLTTTTYQSNETYVVWQYDNPTAGVDNVIIGTIIGLAICAFIFAYLHSNSQSFTWAQLWLLFSVLMLVALTMAIDIFANEQGNTTLAGVAFALFMAFIFVFIILMVRLIWVLLKQYIDELMAVLNGRKTDKGKR